MVRLRAFTIAFVGLLLLGSAAVVAQESGRWTKGAPMPVARAEIALTEVAGKIYVVGGIRSPLEVAIYDPATDAGAMVRRCRITCITRRPWA